MANNPLDLVTRSGLPDHVSHLRAGYPRAAWPHHPNYGGMIRHWLGIHAMLRRETAAVDTILTAARADPQAPFEAQFVPAINQLLGHLDMHHRIEDANFFPRFRAADPKALAAIDVLESDHHLIEATLERTAHSARALLATPAGFNDKRRAALDTHAGDFGALSRMLDRHLNDEEEIVVPALLVHGERVLG